MVRALGRRVGDEDPVDLALIVELRDEVEAAITAAMQGQRRLFSDAEIGAGIGLSKQAVHKRLGARTAAQPGDAA